jgi:ParB family chromosome partitioning protein
MATGAFENLFTLARQAGTEQTAKDSRTVPVTALVASAEQPRRFFADAALAELAESLKAHGLLQPILCRPLPGDPSRYQIVAGERRFRASQLAGLDRVPIVVRALDDKAALEIGLAENLLREDLKPLEEAATMRRLIEEFGYTYDALGAKLGKGKNYVWHRTNLLKLPADVQAALDGMELGAITTGHAEALAGIASDAWRQRAIAAVIQHDLSVAETRRRTKQLQALTTADLPEDRRDALAVAVIETGLSDAGLATRLQPGAGASAAPAAPRQVDVRQLGSFDLFRQARQQPLIDLDEAIAILKRDLARLRREKRDGAEGGDGAGE